METCRMQSNPSLPLLTGTLWPGVVISVRLPYINRVYLYKNYLNSIEPQQFVFDNYISLKKNIFALFIKFFWYIFLHIITWSVFCLFFVVDCCLCWSVDPVHCLFNCVDGTSLNTPWFKGVFWDWLSLISERFVKRVSRHFIRLSCRTAVILSNPVFVLFYFVLFGFLLSDVLSYEIISHDYKFNRAPIGIARVLPHDNILILVPVFCFTIILSLGVK